VSGRVLIEHLEWDAMDDRILGETIVGLYIADSADNPMRAQDELTEQDSDLLFEVMIGCL
jgi:hypothetical protein